MFDEIKTTLGKIWVQGASLRWGVSGGQGPSEVVEFLQFESENVGSPGTKIHVLHNQHPQVHNFCRGGVLEPLNSEGVRGLEAVEMWFIRGMMRNFSAEKSPMNRY
ncbi:hypothetical protein PoB_001061500 [Plakobranchus ocellatus]|uniref:Uncharacterized protein n=1 Tax=Plakobranchus ocellatus TaxID=259542 RepID=A0AAV3YLX6_9GAST|nr:hypothetical protein PoB_001061500 [Plakobranchus ocellatus]